MGDQRITLRLADLLEALALRSKMKRAPRGVRATGLRDIAILPVEGGVIFEMPGIAQKLYALEGELTQSAAFPTKNLDQFIRVLNAYRGVVDRVSIELTPTEVSFKCAGTRRSFPRLAV